MSKYHVTLNSTLKNVVAKEVYAINADSVEEAQALVTGGEGRRVSDVVTYFGACTNEEVLYVEEVTGDFWGGFNDD